MKKKMLSILLVLCMVLAFLPALSFNTSAATYYANGKAFPNNSFKADGSNPYCQCSLPVGTGTKDNGHVCCFLYAMAAYNYIWDQTFSKYGDSGKNNDMLRNLSSSERTTTVAHVKAFFNNAVPGANVRFTNSLSEANDPYYTRDESGHSLIFLGVNSGNTGAYMLEGNYDYQGHSRIELHTWDSMTRRGYLKYIIWPGAKAYDPTPAKPMLKDLRTKYANGESVVLKCDAVSWANQYSFVAEKWNGSEWKTVHRQARSTSRECTINVTEGKYRVYVLAYDTTRFMPDGSDYYYVVSDRVTFTVAGDHVCDNAEYVYYWKAHPHYNCYRCSICGKVNEDRNSSNFIESCRECHRPSKPAFVDLQQVYKVGETITFRWNATANTTHYNFWIWKQDDTGTWEDDHGKWKTYEHLFDIESGKTYELPAGEYRLLLTACNKNWWEEDNSDYLHNESDFCYFSVKTPCEIDGHVWDDGVVTQEPTAAAEGVKTFTCTVCGETRTESIAKLVNPFKDVNESRFFFDAVLWAVSQEPQITSGYSDNTFRPDLTCTRAHVVTFLWRAKGCPEPESLVSPFKDVANTGIYYYKAVLWAAEHGITTGYSDGTFRPNDECIRSQIVTFLWRANSSPDPENANNPFKDVPNGKFYTKAVLWAVENGVTTGYSDGTFRPDNECTRGQVVTFLYRASN